MPIGSSASECEEPLLQLGMPSLSPWGDSLHSTLMLLLTGQQELCFLAQAWHCH